MNFLLSSTLLAYLNVSLNCRHHVARIHVSIPCGLMYWISSGIRPFSPSFGRKPLKVRLCALQSTHPFHLTLSPSLPLSPIFFLPLPPSLCPSPILSLLSLSILPPSLPPSLPSVCPSPAGGLVLSTHKKKLMAIKILESILPNISQNEVLC